MKSLTRSLPLVSPVGVRHDDSSFAVPMANDVDIEPEWNVVFFMVWLLIRVNDWWLGVMPGPSFKCGNTDSDQAQPAIQ